MGAVVEMLPRFPVAVEITAAAVGMSFQHMGILQCGCGASVSLWAITNLISLTITCH